MSNFSPEGPEPPIPPRQTVWPGGPSPWAIKKEETDAVKLLAHIHLYPPTHNAGAEWMLHGILRYLKEERGMEIQVITDQPPERNDEFEGIKVRFDRKPQNLNMEYQFSSVVITHLDATRKSVEFAAKYGRPVVHLIHNDRQLSFHGVKTNQCALAVFNSQWLLDEVEWPGQAMIVHPPTKIADYKVDTRGADAITLINLNAQKGVRVFYELAAAFPEERFIGVTGGYGPQVPAPNLPNLEILPHTPDIKAVYAQTKILLVPSHYESWGRVAVEAACSGIPSIASPTPGLREAGVSYDFPAVDNVPQWVAALRNMLEPTTWTRASNHAKRRSEQLDALVDTQMAELADRIESL